MGKISKFQPFKQKSTIVKDVLEEKKLESTGWNLVVKIIVSVLQISEEKLNNLKGVHHLEHITIIFLRYASNS